jgi:hypothetical protein
MRQARQMTTLLRNIVFMVVLLVGALGGQTQPAGAMNASCNSNSDCSGAYPYCCNNSANSTATCCDSPNHCYDGFGCCQPPNIYGAGICCVYPTQPSNWICCPAGEIGITFSNKCCPQAQYRSQLLGCCPDTQVACETNCCPGGSVCCNGACCPSGSTCCNTTCSCPTGSTCCEGGCCPNSKTCCNGECWPTSQCCEPEPGTYVRCLFQCTFDSKCLGDFSERPPNMTPLPKPATPPPASVPSAPKATRRK